MTAYKDMTKEELTGVKEELERQFQEVKAKGLKLDMSRGKPVSYTHLLNNQYQLRECYQKAASFYKKTTGRQYGKGKKK